MNYKKIYYEFCGYFKNTTPEERLRNRNPFDFRLDNEKLYTERHHIIPKHSGGTDVNENLVDVLPEEHLFIHTVRYKAYKDRNDFLAVRFIINGYLNKSHKECFELSLIGKNLTKRIGIYKTLMNKFRNEYGWHTEDGKRRISEARKNKMPCVDSKTGMTIGMVDTNHPNVLNGNWVHHSTGKISVTEKSSGERKTIQTSEYKKYKSLYFINSRQQNGKNNGNYKIMTDDDKDTIYELVRQSIIENHFVKSLFVEKLKEKFSGRFKRISYVWVENNIGNVNALIDIVNDKFNTEYVYNPYFRSTKQKDKARKQESENVWLTNGYKNIRIRKIDINKILKQNPDYYRGRTL